MNGAFRILESVKKAYIFTALHRSYLLRVSAVPLLLHLATALGLHAYRPGSSVLEAFLWGFPANVAFAWLLFAQTRLLLLGERVDRLPHDGAYLRERRDAMRLSVIVFLLCNMAVTSALAAMEGIASSQDAGMDAPALIPFFALLGVLFWGLRFSVLHILAAVHYPFRPFLRRVHGMEFPFRLLGMGMVCVLPVYMLLEIVRELALSAVPDPAPAEMTLLIVVSVPVALLAPLLLNAAAAYALKDMLGVEQKAFHA